MPNMNRFAREAIPIAICALSIVVGHAVGAVITCAILGGLLAGAVRMKIRSPKSKTLPLRWHLLLTVLLSGSSAAFLLGWSRSWKTFAINAALAPLPLMLLPAMLVVQLSSDHKNNQESALKQMAVLEDHAQLVEQDAAYFVEGFTDGSLNHVSTNNVRDDAWDAVKNEPYNWSSVLMRTVLNAASANSMETPVRDRLMDIAEALEYDTVTFFISRAAMDASYERRDAHVVEKTGSSIEELLNTEGGKEILSSVPDLKYPGISTLLCKYNSETSELIGFDIMPIGYHLDGMKIDALAPMRAICQSTAEGKSLEHLGQGWK